LKRAFLRSESNLRISIIGFRKEPRRRRRSQEEEEEEEEEEEQKLRGGDAPESTPDLHSQLGTRFEPLN
jgi:hypothetical protein